jgi:hypothetical protein
MNTSKPVSIAPFIWKSTSFISRTTLSLLLVVGLLTVVKNTSQFVENITNLFDYQVTKPQIDDPHIIIKQMSSVSELTTSVFVMDTIVPASSRRRLGNIILGKTKLLYVARGEVKAGLDLSKIQPQHINIDGDSIVIKLPAPEILDSKVDVSKSQVYDYDRGFLNLGPDVAPQLQIQAQHYTLNQIKKNACEQDILKQANDKAVTLITQLMTNVGYTNVKVIVTDNNDCS